MVWLGAAGSERAGPSLMAEGIMAATLIATPQGWRQAASLMPGQPVLTFDSGPQPVSQVQLFPLGEGPATLWPLLVPVWALDNREEVVLLPEQKVLIETDLAEDLYGDPFALIPAQALEGWRGIMRCRPPAQAAVVQLGFDRPQVLYASRGVLLSCPGDPFWAEDEEPDPHYSACTLAQARHLIACLIAEEAGATLRQARPPRPGCLA